MAVQILALQQRATANDANGNPLAGAKIYTYETGTTTPLTTYTTSALSVANTNPIVADAAGRFGPIYTDGAVAVKAVITTSADVTVDTLDPAPFVYDSQGAASQISATPNALLTSDTVQGALDQVTTELQTQAAFYGFAAGGPNVLTIATNIGIPALVDRMQVIFRPPANNTGGVTLNVDGTGAVAARTIGAEILPPDYLVAGQLTVARYNGSIWIVDRHIESSTGANGNFTRFADGTQICTHTINLGSRVANGTGTYSNPYRTTEASWTFEKPFSASPTITIVPRIDTATGPARNGSPAFRTISATGITGILLTSVTGDATAVDVIAHVTATGNWF